MKTFGQWWPKSLGSLSFVLDTPVGDGNLRLC